eukprot:1159230-Pelagomonas_calceolata.AAC.5
MAYVHGFVVADACWLVHGLGTWLMYMALLWLMHAGLFGWEGMMRTFVLGVEGVERTRFCLRNDDYSLGWGPARVAAEERLHPYVGGGERGVRRRRG